MAGFKILVACLLVATFLATAVAKPGEERKGRRRKDRSIILFEGEAAGSACQDCLCSAHYSLVCSTCAPQLELLVPCGTTVIDLMIKAANMYEAEHPDDDPAQNPYSFTTEYRGKSGQAVVGMAGIVPTDHEWQLFINSRYVGSNIKTASIERSGDFVKFRLIPKETTKRSADIQSLAEVQSAMEMVKQEGDLFDEDAEEASDDMRSREVNGWESEQLDETDMDDINGLREKFNTIWPHDVTEQSRSPTSATRAGVWKLFSGILKQLAKCSQSAADAFDGVSTEVEPQDEVQAEY